MIFAREQEWEGATEFRNATRTYRLNSGEEYQDQMGTYHTHGLTDIPKI